MERKAKVERISKETQVLIDVNLDGAGNSDIKTSIAFLDHMLVLFSKHSCIDLKINAKGDTEVDDHHTVEDIGICLGDAIQQALGDKTGIRRYGSCSLPMDETLMDVALDISGRPFLVFNSQTEERYINSFDLELIEEFFRALVNKLGLTLHINLRYGKNEHHIYEAAFKSFAVALKNAISIDCSKNGVPSSKGLID